MPKPLLFLDTETTSKEGRMIQLATKTVKDETCNVDYFKAPEPITIGAMAIHHITNEMMEEYVPLSESPSFFDELQNIFDEYTIVAHNAPFDVEVLRREGFIIEEENVIDTLRVARHLLPELEAHSLQYLRYYFGCTFPKQINPHDAESDVLVLESVFNRLALLVAEKYKFGPEEIASDQPGAIEEKMIELSNEPLLLPVLPFGKHKGKKFDVILVQDRQYMSWLDDQDNLDEDLKYTLQYWLLGKYKEEQPKLL